MATDYANLVPANVARELIAGAIEESAVLQLARVLRVPAGTSSIPVVSALPTAGFVTAHGGRKPAAVIEWSSERITPEEIAVVAAIPDDFIEDATFPIWDEVRPLLAQAIGQVLDAAVLWGTGAPASFPTGGVEAVAGAAETGATVLEAVSNAMAVVEQSGLMPTGHVAGPQARPELRLLRDEAGNLVYMPAVTEGAPDRLFGLPLEYTRSWESDAELLTGDWNMLVVGIRTDIRFDLSNEGVLTDGAGVVTANAFQDDLTLMRAYMRVGAAIGQPATLEGVGQPFALAEFTAPAGVARASGSTAKRSSSSSSKRSSGSKKSTAASGKKASEAAS